MILSKLFRGTIGQATGELALIVIGILVALSADQWLAEREDRKLLMENMLNVRIEIDRNVASFANIRDNGMPPKMEALGEVIRVLEQETSTIDDPEEFFSLLMQSAEPMEPWFSRNVYDALKTSGVYHLLNTDEMAENLGSTYESHSVLFDQANAMDGKYGTFVMQFVPSRYQSSLSVMKNYVWSDSVAPTIKDTISAEQAVLELLEHKSQVLALARNEAAVITGKWYALTRMKDDFVALEQNLDDYLESRNVKLN